MADLFGPGFDSLQLHFFVFSKVMKSQEMQYFLAFFFLDTRFYEC